jgi:hypothetical protein
MKEGFHMKKNLCVIILIALALSCKSNPIDGNSPPTITLTGKWLWMLTEGGFAYQIFKPSANERTIIQFTIDNNYYIYSNDTLKRSTQYSVRKGKSVNLDTLMWQDMPGYKKVIQILTKDSLLLCDPGADGFNSLYVKVLQ